MVGVGENLGMAHKIHKQYLQQVRVGVAYLLMSVYVAQLRVRWRLVAGKKKRLGTSHQQRPCSAHADCTSSSTQKEVTLSLLFMIISKQRQPKTIEL